jgi:hypothetical protein
MKKKPSPTHPKSGLPPLAALADNRVTSTVTHRHQDRGNGNGDGEVLGDDLLFGADQIAAFLKRSPRWVYHQQRNLQLSHIGATLLGSKTKLKKLLLNEAT